METLFLYLIFAAPVLWLASLFLLLNWPRFWRFFLLNALLLIGYLGLLNSSLVSFGHDEYGLKALFTMIAAIVLHVVLGFGFAVGFRLYHARSHS